MAQQQARQKVQRLSIRLFESEAELFRIVSDQTGHTPAELAREFALDGLLDHVIHEPESQPER